MTYLHLPAGREPPVLGGVGRFRAVLVLRQTVTDEWQTLISDWLVRSGCLYMMAWGVGCSSWDDSVDWANRSVSEVGEVPDDQFVMTTWHDSEPLSETLWFAAHTAHHPTMMLKDLVIIDIGPEARERELLDAYAVALADAD